MLDELCERPLIAKTRYACRVGGLHLGRGRIPRRTAAWSSLRSNYRPEATRFERPPWVGHEVSDDPRYFNISRASPVHHLGADMSTAALAAGRQPRRSARSRQTDLLERSGACAHADRALDGVSRLPARTCRLRRHPHHRDAIRTDARRSVRPACFALAPHLVDRRAGARHVTSLVLMTLLVLTAAGEQDKVLAVLGLDVIWLNVMAFILSAILVHQPRQTSRAVSLRQVWRSAGTMLLAFVALQLVLAPLIPATAARAVMTLPLMLVVAAIYRSTSARPTNFGRNLFLQNLLGIGILCPAS